MSDLKLSKGSAYVALLLLTVFSTVFIGPAGAYSASNKLNVDLWYTPSHYGSTEALVATVLKDSLEATGMMSVSIHSQEWASYIDAFTSLSLPVLLLGWYPDYIDPDDYLYTFGTSFGTPSIGTNYTNAEMDSLAIQARQQTTQAARTALYEQMQTQLAEDSPVIPLWQSVSQAVTKANIKGVILDASAIFRFYVIEGTSPMTTLKIGTTDKLVTLDPASADDYFSVTILQNIGDGLLRYVPGTTNLENAMASSYTVSPSGLNYTVTLKPGLEFENGNAIDASVFKYSIERARDMNGDPAYLLQGLVQSVDVISSTQFRVNLAYPFSVFPALMAAWVTYPVDPATFTTAEFNDEYVANGPYKVTAWTRDVELDLAANPNYYGAQPKVPNVQIKFYADSSALKLALQTGAIDVAFHGFTPTDYTSFLGDPNFKAWEGPGERIRYMVINTQMPPFDDKRVRQAIAYSVNRTAIRTQVFQDTVDNLYSMVPMGMWSQIDSWKTKYGAEPNLAQAQALLSSITVPLTPALALILAPFVLVAYAAFRRKVWKP